ncbi:MAG: organoarsenical effux MFS transporter ArsJ [Pseudomonadota bacterium]|nr:organoarsenical effux MFS transporter ArsJ [Pseudomonadota bacterium]MEC8619769.1 organoarsenical effux MFS transporter ArsJ [Pseudomonadota bacterium]
MNTQQYAIITGSYWVFTLTDGALRMLVVLYFHELGYGPLDIAFLFLFYEFFGIITNLLGGWLAARMGLSATILSGLFLQTFALGMLLVDSSYLTVAYVMTAQALSGIAKDLNKLGAKSGLKLVAGDSQVALYRLVAWLTGSKNALKGVGFFAGGAGLATIGFNASVVTMILCVGVVGLFALLLLDMNLGKASFKPKFPELFSKSRQINLLSAARLFLFAARDVWFVVALPVFLQVELGWSSISVGTFIATWVIGYGLVQAIAPKISNVVHKGVPDGRAALLWSLPLVTVPVAMALGLQQRFDPAAVIVFGLACFALVFAMNSALHSFLITSYANSDGVSLDVGFYYMANAVGRLLGTVCSGWVYQVYGLAACLTVSAFFFTLVLLISLRLPRHAK